MQRIETGLQDCFILKPNLFEDQRGFFYESYQQEKFNKLNGSTIHFVQDNMAMSQSNTLRGLHYQKAPYAQAKLVTVISGKVIDVAVDVRKSSPTFGKHIAVELSAKNHLQLFIPAGFAHGYAVLEDNTIFYYKCDQFYHKDAEAGIHPLDTSLNINWSIQTHKAILSEKDKMLPSFNLAHYFD